jgi:hypothetical protein
MAVATPVSEGRRAAVDAVVRSIRTGEHSASVVATRFLAPDIVPLRRFDSEGHKRLLYRATGLVPESTAKIRFR